jgi:succinate dehydrogenase / fumarate reductase cytochrome b subunit
MKQIHPRNNSLGPGSWIWAGNYKLERYLYILHRITGLSLLLFFLIYLVTIVLLQIQGRDAWGTTLALIHNKWFGIVVVLFIYHSLNGLRLTLQETGFALGRPAQPSYPYQDALRKKRPLTIVMLAIIVTLALLFLFIFFVVGVR